MMSAICAMVPARLELVYPAMEPVLILKSAILAAETAIFMAGRNVMLVAEQAKNKNAVVFAGDLAVPEHVSPVVAPVQ